MSDIYCAICGEPYERYHYHYDMVPWEAKLFAAGAGCPGCEGYAPDVDPDYVFELSRMEPKPDSWIQPDDPTVWECEDCHATIKRTMEPDSYGELYWEHKQAQQFYHWPRKLDDFLESIDSDGNPSLVESLAIDGKQYCPICAATCDDCGEVFHTDDLRADPRNPYAPGNGICETCENQIPTCCECGGTCGEDYSIEPEWCNGYRCKSCSISCTGRCCSDCDGWKFDPLKYYDPGCYADGSLGHDHIRSKLAELIENHGVKNPELVTSLRGDMPDDAWDEDDAIDELNDLVPDGSDHSWEFHNGDLMFWNGGE